MKTEASQWMSGKEAADKLEKALHQRLASLTPTPQEDVVIIGIRSSGTWIAKRLHRALGIKRPLGVLDISYYRDDFSCVGVNPQVLPSTIPHGIDGCYVVLVDDVIHTGRTVVAALKELADFGRPKNVILAVLANRSGREMPISADIFAMNCELADNQYLKLHQDGKFRLTVREKG